MNEEMEIHRNLITGKTEIQDDSYKWGNQYIDLWVTILTVIETNFMEA